jgi:dinuclear metal center YbgI/SA1388 family protein
MAIAYNKLVKHIEKIAPPGLAENGDNCGVQVYTGADSIHKVAVALDISLPVINEAVLVNADMIIAHHPLIFDKINKIDHSEITGKYICELIRHGISVYAAHTTFDSADGGNNDYLSELLELEGVSKVEPEDGAPTPGAYLRIGELASGMKLKDVSRKLKEKLNIAYEMPIVGDPESVIRKVAVCTGGGGSLVKEVLRNRCSLFITSDIRHHEAMFAKENGMCLIDAGHFYTEIIFVANFAKKLKAEIGDLAEVYEIQTEVSPFSHI